MRTSAGGPSWGRSTSRRPPLSGPGPRYQGLIRLDQARSSQSNPWRATWFGSPSIAKAQPVDVPSVGTWETQLDLRLGWSLPHGEAWFALLPDEDLRDDWNDWAPAGFDRSESQDCHQLFGWRSGGLDEPYTEPLASLPRNVDDYEMLLRLTFDNPAGFYWGTNWIYVLVPKDDLARGDFSRLWVTGANS